MVVVAAAVHANKHKAEAHHGSVHHGGTKEDVDCDTEEHLAAAAAAAAPLPIGVGFWKYQAHAEWLYGQNFIQFTVAGLIGLNFVCNIVQAQIDPTGKNMVAEFAPLEWFFNIAFLMELILNMYGTWCCKFWKSGWNIFDFMVVLIGWLFQVEAPLPGPMKLLRMMRAFRVFRLFKRIESLRKILNSLAKAVPGVMNAFIIQLIVVCIFAMIAVDRFRDYGEGGSFTNEHGDVIMYQTSRGQDFGKEYFGNFGASLYTMFQVLTGESWAEAITRPMLNSDNPTTSTGSGIFFVFFCILNGIVLINVVVAVLLEKMVDEPATNEDGEVEEDPMQVTLQHNQKEVAKLKIQMDYMTKVIGAMQSQVGDVAVVKAQVAALIAHAGAEAPPFTRAEPLNELPPDQTPEEAETWTTAMSLPLSTLNSMLVQRGSVVES